MELLILLLSRPGDLVSREEIAGHLWGGDVFVDVDHSINTAVRKIRVALGDSPEKPRFIETIVGKGYRFSAPVICDDVVSKSQVQPPAPSEELSLVPPVVSARQKSLPFLPVVLWAAGVVLAMGTLFLASRTEYFWRNPIANARFQTVTDFDGVAGAATISRDGHFVAFLSDQDGQMDVWVTQTGSGQFHNLTHGSASEVLNPSIRTLGFSPDGSLVTFWVRKPDSNGDNISIWAVPTLGGQPTPYLEGAAELDWSPDGTRLAYHTPGPGDPLFVSGANQPSERLSIFTAPTGLHSHFPSWARDGKFIYFVLGSLPDKLDVWKISPTGGKIERVTSQNGRVDYPVLFGRRTLMYLASDPDGSGPWLYGMDLDRRIPHRLSSGPESYTSLAASFDDRHLVATLAVPRKTLWRLRIFDSSSKGSAATQIPLTTRTGSAPRLGPNYLLYVSSTGTSDSIWKLSSGNAMLLWGGQEAQLIGRPAISPNGEYIAFSIRQHSQTSLYVMHADGTNARLVTSALDLRGSPAWAPDNQSLISSAEDRGIPHLFRIPIDGQSITPFVRDYSVDPAVAPDGNFVVYSGPDIGTTFSMKAATPEGSAYPFPALNLTRGAQHVGFLHGGRGLVLMRGGIQHKDLWVIELETGVERQLTNLPPDFDLSDFDIAPDGSEVVLERVQEHSDVVLLDLPKS